MHDNSILSLTYFRNKYLPDLPDGIRSLFEYADIEPIEIFISGIDTIGIGVI
jgi:hypothetical protein